MVGRFRTGKLRRDSLRGVRNTLATKYKDHAGRLRFQGNKFMKASGQPGIAASVFDERVFLFRGIWDHF